MRRRLEECRYDVQLLKKKWIKSEEKRLEDWKEWQNRLSEIERDRIFRKEASTSQVTGVRKWKVKDSMYLNRRRIRHDYQEEEEEEESDDGWEGDDQTKGLFEEEAKELVTMWMEE